MKCIDRNEALSYPFANDEYDKEHANMDFILGSESYKEWLETLPVIEVQDEGYALTTFYTKMKIIYNIAKMCIENGGYNFDISFSSGDASINVYPWGD